MAGASLYLADSDILLRVTKRDYPNQHVSMFSARLIRVLCQSDSSAPAMRRPKIF